MRTLHSTLCALAPALLLGQQPFPTWADEPRWNVLSCIYGVGFWCDTHAFQFSDTATLCGHTYSVLELPGATAYFRNEGQRTLFRTSTGCAAKEYLAYDYSMAAGDTVYAGLNMDMGQPDTAMLMLQSIDTVDVLGVQRRRFAMKYDPCNQESPLLYATMHWIEGIGSPEHPFYPLHCFCDGCESSYGLLCLDSAGTALYRNPALNTCDTMLTDVGIHVPASGGPRFSIGTEGGGVITLHYPPDFKQGPLRIMDMGGRTLLVRSTGASLRALDLSMLPSGVYVAMLGDGHGGQWTARWVHTP